MMPQIGKRARQKLERPGEILEAARLEFVQKGYMAARIEDVAKAVGVTKGTVYFYFETKEALFNAVIRHFAPVSFAMPEMPVQGRVREALSAYLTELYSHITINQRTREIFHLLMAEGRHFPQLVDAYFTDFLEPALGSVRQLLRLGMERGEFRRTGIDAYAELLLSPAVLASIWTSVFGQRRPIEHERFLSSYFDVFFEGLEARA